MDNVIKFPSTPGGEAALQKMPNTLEEVKANVELIRHVHINEVTEVIITTMIQQMMNGGFNIMDDQHEKDFAFLIESVRSSLCKTVGIYHPFQDVSDKIMEQHAEEEGVLTIADHINVKFQNEENAIDDTATSETGI